MAHLREIDLSADGRLAVFGFQRDEKVGMAPDGAIVFAARAGSDDLFPIVYAKSGPGAPELETCGMVEHGVVRFLPDGRLLVVPGAEAGATLLSPDYVPVARWGADLLPAAPVCPTEVQRRGLDTDEPARWRFVNRFELVDEVFPTAAGPLLALRTSAAAGTRWRGLLLLADGGHRNVALPFRSDSPNAHLRGDVLGNRLLALTFVRDESQGGRDAQLMEVAVSDLIGEPGS
jgi:hypothetical protein